MRLIRDWLTDPFTQGALAVAAYVAVVVTLIALTSSH